MPAKSNKKLPSEWKPGDLCWAKMRGYPTWPGVVLAQPPPDLLLQRGLCPQVSVPVVFFGTRDYQYVKRTELLPYEPNKAKFSNGSKEKRLLSAIKEAEENPEILVQMALNPVDYGAVDSAASTVDDQADEVEPPKRGKKRRMDEVPDAVEPDVLLPPGCSVPAPEPTKKRSPNNTTSSSSKKVKHAPRPETLAIPVENLPSVESVKVDTETAEPGADVPLTAEPQPFAPSPAAGKTDQERLLSLRHKLQRIFLSKPEPRAQDFPRVDGIMSEVEQFPLTVDLLRNTKIGKVMKRLAVLKLENEPANVCTRSAQLIAKWKALLAESLEITDLPGGSPAIPKQGENMLEYLIDSPHVVNQDNTTEKQKAEPMTKPSVPA